jgi:hypothetical protein
MRGGRRGWRRGLSALTAKLKAVGTAVALE